MKSLVCIAPGKLEFIAVEKPLLQKDSSIIRIRRIGICGTDLHAFEGTQPFFSYPRILGHELSGDLVEFDNAPGFISGEKVSFIPYFHCGSCLACRNGKPNCCAKLRVCGVHIDGGMAEYISVPSSSLLHSDGLSYDELALLEPLAIGAHGIRRANIERDEFVLIVGAGPIGLATMEFARIAGGNVIVMDVNEKRLEFCRNKLRVAHTVSANAVDVNEQLKNLTNGDMPVTVIDATGNIKAINNAFRYMTHGSKYVLIGLQKENITFNHPEFHKREATLMSSRNATRQDFDHVIASIKKGLIDPTVYITHRVGFDETINYFEDLLKPSNGVIKAMVEVT